MQADLIIAVGLDCVELQPKSWPYQVPVIALASTASLDALLPAQIEAVGDLKAMLKSLATLTSGGAAWGERAAATFRRDVVDALNTPSRGLSPQRAMEVARAVLPRRRSLPAMPAQAAFSSCRNGNPTVRASS
jgi:acetolactate synthase-1/2/3 large subunit